MFWPASRLIVDRLSAPVPPKLLAQTTFPLPSNFATKMSELPALLRLLVPNWMLPEYDPPTIIFPFPSTTILAGAPFPEDVNTWAHRKPPVEAYLARKLVLAPPTPLQECTPSKLTVSVKYPATITLLLLSRLTERAYTLSASAVPPMSHSHWHWPEATEFVAKLAISASVAVAGKL